MISKQAIDNYINREFESFNWIKEVSKTEILEAINSLPTKPKLKVELYTHQLASFYIGTCIPNFLFFLDMGTGKTLLTLALIDYWKQLGKVSKALVVVPNVVNVEGWREEIEQNTHLRFVSLHGSLDKKLKALETSGDVYVINYDSLQVAMAELRPKKVKGKIKNTRTIIPELVEHFTSHFQLVVYDEIHRAKNPKSLIYKLCKEVSLRCSYQYGLTGTPLGRDPIDLWAEFNLVDDGETLGKNLALYTSAFFTTKVNYWGALEHKFDKRKQTTLNKMVQHRSLRYEDHECSDLPESHHITVNLTLSSDALAHYRTLLEDYVNVDERDTKEIKNYYSKFRQIASGFVYVKDEETDDRLTMEFSHCEKLDALLELLENMPVESKLVIFHVFNKTGSVIHEFLSKLKIPHALINSVAKNSRISEYNKFKTDPKCKVLVCNIQSGSEGLNLQVANYMCIYEPTDRPIWHKQALKRINRQGQKADRVHYYHFCTKGTIEEKVMEFIREGKSLFEALIEGKTKLKHLHGSKNAH